MSVESPDDLVAPPPEGRALLLETHVAGVGYYDFADASFPLDAGSSVELRREPDNDHDRRAIEVRLPDGRKLGYLPRRRNKLPSRLIDAGHRLRGRIESVRDPQSDPDCDEAPPDIPTIRVAVFVDERAPERTTRTAIEDQSETESESATDAGTAPDSEQESNRATASDWDVEPLPQQHTVVELNRWFDADQMRDIRRGFVPRVMEEKWFLYWSDGELHIHRSWTGHCIYVVEFRESDGGAKMVRARANRDPDQFDRNAPDYDRHDIHELIDNFLLAERKQGHPPET